MELGGESGETNNTKVVDNFDIFSESIDTPSYDQWLRSYDHCKLVVLDLDRLSYLDKFGL
jgi:hypothetical protein